MISQLDQECADAIAAIHRWLALQLQKIIAARPPSSGPVDTDDMDQLKVDVQAALNWMHIYQEALKAALKREGDSNPFKNPGD